MGLPKSRKKCFFCHHPCVDFSVFFGENTTNLLAAVFSRGGRNKIFFVAFVTHVHSPKHFGIHSITMARPVAAQSCPVLGVGGKFTAMLPEIGPTFQFDLISNETTLSIGNKNKWVPHNYVGTEKKMFF